MGPISSILIKTSHNYLIELPEGHKKEPSGLLPASLYLKRSLCSRKITFFYRNYENEGRKPRGNTDRRKKEKITTKARKAHKGKIKIRKDDLCAAKTSEMSWLVLS
jgi:hypothetical protein